MSNDTPTPSNPSDPKPTGPTRRGFFQFGASGAANAGVRAVAGAGSQGLEEFNALYAQWQALAQKNIEVSRVLNGALYANGIDNGTFTLSAIFEDNGIHEYTDEKRRMFTPEQYEANLDRRIKEAAEDCPPF